MWSSSDLRWGDDPRSQAVERPDRGRGSRGGTDGRDRPPIHPRDVFTERLSLPRGDEWARAHELPYFDDRVHIPDVRIEYEDRDGRLRFEDLEVVTPHYRGAHAAAVARSGFSTYRGGTVRLGARAQGGRRGGRGWDPRLAEEMLR